MNLQQIEAFAALASTLGSVLTSVLPTLFTTIDAVARSIEASFPAASGSQKFNAAMTRLEAIYGEVVSSAPNVFGALVNSSVAILNALGEFKHTTVPAVAAASPTSK